VRLNSVEIAGIPRQFEPPAVENVVEVGYGESLVLYGYTLEMQNGIQLDLVWQAANSVEADYTVFVHVVDEAGTTVVQHDAMPRSSTYPTSLWQAGEYVQERITFQDLPEGTYTLRVGLYIQADGTRLPVIDVTNNQYDFYEIHADGVIHR